MERKPILNQIQRFSSIQLSMLQEQQEAQTKLLHSRIELLSNKLIEVKHQCRLDIIQLKQQFSHQINDKSHQIDDLRSENQNLNRICRQWRKIEPVIEEKVEIKSLPTVIECEGFWQEKVVEQAQMIDSEAFDEFDGECDFDDFEGSDDFD